MRDEIMSEHSGQLGITGPQVKPDTDSGDGERCFSNLADAVKMLSQLESSETVNFNEYRSLQTVLRSVARLQAQLAAEVERREKAESLTDAIIVYRDGTWKQVEAANAWEYENDPDYLVTIPAVADRSAFPADKEQVK